MAQTSGGRRLSSIAADAALLTVALVWGATFVMVKEALSDIRPLAFLFVRFSLAFLVLLPLCWRPLRRGGIAMAIRGALIGWWLFAGYATQTIGLQWTTAGKAGFITGLAVVFVPLLTAVAARRMPSRASLVGVGLATLGLGLMTLGGDLRPAPGDLWVLACALCFAMHIITVGRSGARTTAEAAGFAGAQIAATALYAGVATLALETPYWLALLSGVGPGAPQPNMPSFSADVILALGVTAVLATAAAFAIQNIAQRHTTPTHTALIFSSEPVFAAAFAWLLAGERFGVRAIFGAGLILGGILLAELRRSAVGNGNTPRRLDRAQARLYHPYRRHVDVRGRRAGGDGNG